MQNHLPKAEDLMLQNAAPQAPGGPPNSSGEHVSCTAPATENASFQILFKCPTPGIVFGNATKPSRFAHFWQGAQSLAPATQNHIGTPKSAPNPSVFRTFDLEMCSAPQRRALFRHLNFQKCSEPVSFLHIWLRNVLPPQRRAIFHLSSSQPDGSAPAALESLLFDPPELQIIGKTQCFATFLPFRAPASSFFSLFLFSDLLSSALLFSDSSHLLLFHLSILSEVWLLNFLRSFIKYQQISKWPSVAHATSRVMFILVTRHTASHPGLKNCRIYIYIVLQLDHQRISRGWCPNYPNWTSPNHCDIIRTCII